MKLNFFNYFSSNTSNFFPVRCYAGSYPNADQTECIQCPLGQYQPDDDKTSCISCPINKSTRAEGSKLAADCEGKKWFLM